jgi:protoporphyrinogen/coproporphyrinogen III oxidase
MIGELEPQSKEITIIGAGIAGMLLARQLDKKGYSVTLLEASSRAGGLIQTLQTPFGIAETAAHSFLASPPVQALCQELSVELLPVKKEARSRWVMRDGKLRKFPLGPKEALRALGRAYFVLADRKQDPHDLTLESWAKRYLGEAALDYLLSPFLLGIYGARPSELTVGAAFPALAVPHGHSLLSYLLARKVTQKKKYASAKPVGPRPMMAPKNGMGDLVQALEKDLRSRLGPRFKTANPVTTIPQSDNLALCVPADTAADLLASVDPRLSSALRAVSYAPLISATTFVSRDQVERPAQGVGFLIPERERMESLGVLLNSEAFEGRVREENRVSSYTVMLGGTLRPELLEASDSRLHAIIAQTLATGVGLRGEPLHVEIKRWSRAVPRYDASLTTALQAARAGWCSRPGRVLFGNYTGQVSIRGMIESSMGL